MSWEETARTGASWLCWLSLRRRDGAVRYGTVQAGGYLSWMDLALDGEAVRGRRWPPGHEREAKSGTVWRQQRGRVSVQWREPHPGGVRKWNGRVRQRVTGLRVLLGGC